MQRHLLFSLLLSFIALFPVFGLAQNSQILGSMPKDGAKDLLRNAVISVGLEFANEEVGFDPKTISPRNIRLYPAKFPGQQVEAFVIADERNQMLLVEPSQLLAPNTRYIFEIKADLRDNNGNAIGPYKISFSTSNRSVPKRISTQRPQIVHKTRKIYLKPSTQIFAEPVIRPTTVAETKIEIPALEEPKATAAPQEEEDPHIANVQVSPENEDEKIELESSLETAQSTTSLESVIAEETKKEEETFVAGIHFTQDRIAANSSLPVEIKLSENSQIQYVVKNTSGVVVKKGSGKLFAGRHEKSLTMADLPPGRYQILIKAGELRQKHIFVIR